MDRQAEAGRQHAQHSTAPHANAKRLHRHACTQHGRKTPPVATRPLILFISFIHDSWIPGAEVGPISPLLRR